MVRMTPATRPARPTSSYYRQILQHCCGQHLVVWIGVVRPAFAVGLASAVQIAVVGDFGHPVEQDGMRVAMKAGVKLRAAMESIDAMESIEECESAEPGGEG